MLGQGGQGGPSQQILPGHDEPQPDGDSPLAGHVGDEGPPLLAQRRYGGMPQRPPKPRTAAELLLAGLAAQPGMSAHSLLPLRGKQAAQTQVVQWMPVQHAAHLGAVFKPRKTQLTVLADSLVTKAP